MIKGRVVRFTYDCTTDGCDGVADDGGTLYTDADPAGSLKLEIEMVAPLTFVCPECGAKYYTGDIDVYAEDEL